jgi:uncharacterized protein
MARRDRPQDRRSQGTHHSGRIGEGEEIREPAVYATRWRNRGTCESIRQEGLLPQVKAIADTGFLVAFGNRKNQHHAWAKDLAGSVTEPLLTCEAVLAEAAFHLRSSAIVLAFITEGLVRPALVLGDHLACLTELAQRYADRKPDLADLCIIRLSELNPRYPVITTDLNNFRVYRRGRKRSHSSHSSASLTHQIRPTSPAATPAFQAADAGPSHSA